MTVAINKISLWSIYRTSVHCNWFEVP